MCLYWVWRSLDPTKYSGRITKNIMASRMNMRQPRTTCNTGDCHHCFMTLDIRLNFRLNRCAHTLRWMETREKTDLLWRIMPWMVLYRSTRIQRSGYQRLSVLKVFLLRMSCLRFGWLKSWVIHTDSQKNRCLLSWLENLHSPINLIILWIMPILARQSYSRNCSQRCS